MAAGRHIGGGAGRSRIRGALALLAAFLISLWVLAANGGALFYYDSGSYVERGQQVLSLVGLDMPTLSSGPRTDLGSPDGPALAGEPETVDGSRSMVYSLLTGLFLWAGALEGMVLFNALLAVGTVWLAVRVTLRDLPGAPAPGLVTLAATGAAALGSLPFYVAYLMPDILAPVLILVAALLAACAPRMRLWELALATALGVLAVTTHLSHLAMAGLLVPLVALTALLRPGPRRWLAPLLMLAVLGMGAGEQKVLRVAADKVEKAEVVYRPFLTARLIQDGPGYAYLDEYCPDTAIPTCALFDALSRSEDPRRLTATNIAFAVTPDLGSFQLLPGRDRLEVAQAQFDFFLDVLRDRPLATVWAFAENVLYQMVLTSVDMTLQTDDIVARNADLPGLVLGGFSHGRLTEDRAWLGWADPAQALLYALSLAVLAGALASRRLPGSVAAFLIMVLAGIAVNAAVCGGLSQPATRYGARVIWLLPAAAVLASAVLLARPGRHALPGAAAAAAGPAPRRGR